MNTSPGFPARPKPTVEEIERRRQLREQQERRKWEREQQTDQQQGDTAE